MKTSKVALEQNPDRKGGDPVAAARWMKRYACVLAAALALAIPAHSVWASPPSVAVRDVKLSALGETGAEVRVATSSEPRFSARVVDQGKRIIVDLENASVEGAPAAITKGNALVAGIMTQGFKTGDQRTTRVLVQLARFAAYRVRVEPAALVIELAPADVTAPMTGRPATLSKDAPEAAAPEATLSNVRFEHKADCDRVVVELTAIPAHTESNGPSGKSTLELSGVKLPGALQRTLEVGAFGGVVKSVSTYRRTSDPTRVVVEVERSGYLRMLARALVMPAPDWSNEQRVS